MTQNQTGVKALAQAVGVDIKQILVQLNQLVTPEQLNQAIEQLRNALLGGASADFDTLKEIADMLEQLKSTDVGQGIVEKLTELKQAIDAIKTELNTDLVAVYTAAKA